MTISRKIFVIAGSLISLALIGTAIFLTLNSRSGQNEAGDSKTPLGGLFSRAAAVSQIKQQMGDLKAAHPALMAFAQGHQDELPKTIAELRPYLPQKLAYLDDEHWELPSTGKMTPLMNGTAANTAILLQQKNLPLDKPKIIVYADGHIEYKK